MKGVSLSKRMCNSHSKLKWFVFVFCFRVFGPERAGLKKRGFWEVPTSMFRGVFWPNLLVPLKWCCLSVGRLESEAYQSCDMILRVLAKGALMKSNCFAFVSAKATFEPLANFSIRVSKCGSQLAKGAYARALRKPSRNGVKGFSLTAVSTAHLSERCCFSRVPLSNHRRVASNKTQLDPFRCAVFDSPRRPLK